MGPLPSEQIANLERIALQIRSLATEMIATAASGHPGGSLSVAEILAVLYFHVLNIRPAEPDWPQRDRFVMSKGHASSALYAALALRGYFPLDWLPSNCELGQPLQGHPDMRKTPGVDMSTGSLGQGLSVAAGMAWAARYQGDFYQVYCLIGDGESNEGQIWEAAQFSAHHHLDNLTVVLDYNKVMAKGWVHQMMSIEPVCARWAAFGFEVMEVDGHDVNELAQALYRACYVHKAGKPTIIVAHTVKGRGVSWMEFNPAWHSHAPTGALAEDALAQLNTKGGGRGAT